MMTRLQSTCSPWVSHRPIKHVTSVMLRDIVLRKFYGTKKYCLFTGTFFKDFRIYFFKCLQLSYQFLIGTPVIKIVEQTQLFSATVSEWCDFMCSILSESVRKTLKQEDRIYILRLTRTKSEQENTIYNIAFKVCEFSQESKGYLKKCQTFY